MNCSHSQHARAAATFDSEIQSLALAVNAAQTDCFVTLNICLFDTHFLHFVCVFPPTSVNRIFFNQVNRISVQHREFQSKFFKSDFFLFNFLIIVKFFEIKTKKNSRRKNYSKVIFFLNYTNIKKELLNFKQIGAVKTIKQKECKFVCPFRVHSSDDNKISSM